MKNYICHIFTILFTICGVMLLGNTTFSALSWNRPTIYTNNESDAINTDISETQSLGDPIREGAYNIVHSSDDKYILEGIVDSDSQITTHEKALNNTLGIVRNVVNYALGMLSFVALVYIIIQGFIMITAMGDDGKVKKGKAGIKRAIIAILGIGLSRFIISFIFWVINGSISGSGDKTNTTSIHVNDTQTVEEQINQIR